MAKEDNNIRNKVAKGMFWTYSERITAQLVSFVVSVILARLIDPEHYGVITLVNVFISIANVFVSDSFGNALIQKKDADEADFSTVFFLNLSVSILLYFIIFAAAPIISSFYNEPQVTPVLRVLSLKLILAAWNSVQNAYVSKNMHFRKFFFATFTGTVISAIVGITMAYMGFGVWALVAQYLTNSFIDTVFLHFTCGWKPHLLFSRSNTKQLFGFGSKLLVAELIQTVYDNMRSLIVGKAFTTTELSYYDRGKRFPALIVDNISSSISKTLFPALSLVQDDRKRMLEMTRRSIKLGSFLLSPLLVGLAVCGDSVIELLLTSKWLPCVPYLRIISITYLFMPLHKANLQAIKALGRIDIILKMEIIKKTFGVLIVLIATFIFRSPIAVAWSFFVGTLFNAVVNARPNSKLLNYKLSDQLKDMLVSFGNALIMGVIVYCIGLLFTNTIVKFFVQVIVGAISYLLLAMISKNESFMYCMNFLKRFSRKKN